MDDTHLCLDTSPLIAYLKGREPGAAAVERAVKDYDCYVVTTQPSSDGFPEGR